MRSRRLSFSLRSKPRELRSNWKCREQSWSACKSKSTKFAPKHNRNAEPLSNAGHQRALDDDREQHDDEDDPVDLIRLLRVGDDGEPFVTLAAFGLEARNEMTQMRFFRWPASEMTLRHCSGKVSIDQAVSQAIRQPLQQKLAAHAANYIKALPDVL